MNFAPTLIRGASPERLQMGGVCVLQPYTSYRLHSSQQHCHWHCSSAGESGFAFGFGWRWFTINLQHYIPHAPWSGKTSTPSRIEGRISVKPAFIERRRFISVILWNWFFFSRSILRINLLQLHFISSPRCLVFAWCWRSSYFILKHFFI